MSKYRTDLLEGDPLPQDFLDTIQEFISTYASPNFNVILANTTTLRVPAGTDNDQVGIAINGKWRYNRTNADVAAPGGLTVGDNPLFVVASANAFGPNPTPPPTELDSTDYTFRLLVLPSGSVPTGTGTQALYRQIGNVTWDGSQFTAIKLTIGGSLLPTYTADVVARSGLAQQVKIGSIGTVAGVALGSAGDVTIVRDTTGTTKATVNVPLNATAFQVGGTALAASHLSNGVTGSGAVVLAVSPAMTGTPTVPTAAVDTSTTQAASTAFVLGQAAAAAPLMDGTAAAGTSTRYARADHVHPSDTSRAALASPTFTGTPAAPTPTAGTNTTQLATTAFVMAAIGGLPGSPVTSVFGRSGAVGAQTGDYAVAQITGAAADAAVVHLAGGETLTGAKQFNVGARWATQSMAASGTVADGTASVVLTDTTTAAFTATLPLTPAAGSWFRFIDSTGKWGTNALTIARNGKNIDGQAANLVLTENNGSLTLYYDGTAWHTVSVGLTGFPSGTPVAPTAAADTNTTQIATTAFVLGQLATVAPLMDGAAVAGVSTRFARADHVHPIDTTRAAVASPTFTGVPAAPTAAVDTSTTQLATTGFVLSQAAAATPLMDGAAAVGTSTRFARADHVHPIDTSRAPLASPGLTGTPLAPTAAVDTSTTQIATTAFVIGQASAAGDGTPAMDGTAARGTSTHYARADHVHPIDTSRAPLASPSLTGTPAAPTPATGTNTTQVATTAFVLAQIGASATTALSDVTAKTGTGTTIVFNASPTVTGTLTAAAITASGNILISGAASALGYTAGAGSAGTTSNAFPSTGTLSRPTGVLTSGAAVPSLNQWFYVITNTVVDANDTIIVNLANGTASVPYTIDVISVGTSTFSFTFYNGGGTSITPRFNYTVVKGSAS